MERFCVFAKIVFIFISIFYPCAEASYCYYYMYNYYCYYNHKDDKVDDGTIAAIVLGSIIGSAIVFIIIGCICYYVNKKTENGESPGLVRVAPAPQFGIVQMGSSQMSPGTMAFVSPSSNMQQVHLVPIGSPGNYQISPPQLTTAIDVSQPLATGSNFVPPNMVSGNDRLSPPNYAEDNVRSGRK